MTRSTDATDLQIHPHTTDIDMPGANRLLDLLHLADSALPIGAPSHSFGLETLTASGHVTGDNLEAFLRDYIEEVTGVECAFCRAAYALGREDWGRNKGTAAAWVALNRRLAALRPARESRMAGEVLGRRFLSLAAEMSESSTLAWAIQAGRDAGIACQHATGFGLAGGALALGPEETTTAYAQQTVAALLAAAQKLLPVGQSALTRMRWQLKPALCRAVARSRTILPQDALPSSFAPLVELASMRHPNLPVRLFIS